jgi:hypothetical protein
MEREPYCTVRVIAEEPQCLVVFEPVGSEYELTAGDEVLVHVYGRSMGLEHNDADIEVARSEGRITLWITSADYQAWNKAGVELNV